jgi:hypothetical protein
MYSGRAFRFRAYWLGCTFVLRPALRPPARPFARSLPSRHASPICEASGDRAESPPALPLPEMPFPALQRPTRAFRPSRQPLTEGPVAVADCPPDEATWGAAARRSRASKFGPGEQRVKASATDLAFLYTRSVH